MFCASLRKRPEWAAAVPILLRKETRAWREVELDTHDIAIPVPGISTIDGSSVRFILLSALDVQQRETLQRIDRLVHLDGGRRCAIVFLLSTDGGADGLSALGHLQIELMEKLAPIPILPLTSLDDVPARLEAFYTRLLTPSLLRERSSPSAEALALLPYCATNPPLPQHATNVLSDINAGFSDLVDKIASHEGRAVLRDYAEDVTERVVRFWTTEFCD